MNLLLEIIGAFVFDSMEKHNSITIVTSYYKHSLQTLKSWERKS
ncbi:hypothetical protein SAMN05421503_3282 [Terribacillus aidingensis]|uniref:Uncharacterized protein n=1 Tax=Terribacillus aidingensis TaxID=586416 RepID=A0A285P8K7_9BACI|nr:hypothetical protein SAMN05421503_3282 [Terribacillus aidingensis]